MKQAFQYYSNLLCQDYPQTNVYYLGNPKSDRFSKALEFSYRWDGDIMEIIWKDDAFNSEFNLFMYNAPVFTKNSLRFFANENPSSFSLVNSLK